ncbi:response regulator transcription factor, partial [Trebonia sp.]|uniref:helix-turn-helix transcriptional regulator n=3 Tax=Trebonia sp. TaxID=2767075 RepID=UPI003CC69721
AEHAPAGSDAWCTARLLLGQVAGEAEDPPAMLAHYTAARDAFEDRCGPAAPSGQGLLSVCLAARVSALLRMGRVAEAVEDGRRAVCLAREAGAGAIEAMALGSLSMAIWQDGDGDGALRLARQAHGIAEGHAGVLRRGLGEIVAGVLIDAGDLAAAERACTTTLAACREVGDQVNLCGVLRDLTILDLRTGRTDAAAAHLGELLQVVTRTGRRSLVHLGLDCCGHLCAATGRAAEAVTAWAAMSALAGPWPPLPGALRPAGRDMLRRRARDLLGHTAARTAEERGAAMTMATATEYALLLAAAAGTTADQPTDLGRLSPRERELVTLVARGRTDAQIATELFITVRTVGSHLDRIRDKTGCRRRADLTRLALTAGLV